jgi:CheY-like chemotaxis protein
MLEHASRKASPAGRRKKMTHERPLVLVVDDDALLRRMLHRLLCPYFDVLDVPSAEDALALVRNGAAFDGILCDLHLDGMSGVEFRKCLEGVNPDQAQRFVLHTGQSSEGPPMEPCADAGGASPLYLRSVSVATYVTMLNRLILRYGRVRDAIPSDVRE